jgi:hypothetical protein
MNNQVKLETREVNEKQEKQERPTQMAHLEEVQTTPICRLCLQERDTWGNFAIKYNSGLIQHKSCMAKYTKNRRALNKVIFKVKYQEYFGDLRPAGLVDREAMEQERKKKKKKREKQKITQQQIEARCAWARKCKAIKKEKRSKEQEIEVETFIKQWDEKRRLDGASIIGETHKREETKEEG